jgi:hypothetical protein
VPLYEAAKRGMDKNYFFEIKRALGSTVKVGGLFKNFLNLEFSQNQQGVTPTTLHLKCPDSNRTTTPHSKIEIRAELSGVDGDGGRV